MTEKIELFKMILERNELCRVSWNTYQRFKYSSKRFLKGHLTDEELVKTRAIESRDATKAVYDFTDKTLKRRRQLAKSLKTKQRKNAVNVIEWVEIDRVRYTPSAMKRDVEEYTCEQILLGRE